MPLMWILYSRSGRRVVDLTMSTRFAELIAGLNVASTIAAACHHVPINFGRNDATRG